MSNIEPTLYWYDFESWGTSPKKDKPSQFAGIRTDLDLNIIGEPLVEYCQIPNDYLPHPEASLITGITPQQTLQKGLIEPEFFKLIHSEIAKPNTTCIGYNNVRFDDEMIRYGLYRNFYDPYAYSWQNNNSRWDILDMVRACYALRPEGINWPVDNDGKPSFRLELLTKANDIEHGSAHDALSDVIATIELAKLIKNKQPKLYNFLFEHRDKNKLSELIDVYSLTPLVHTSGMFSAWQGCTTWISPIGFHPKNKNSIIVYDLTKDPTSLIGLSSEELATKMYTKTADLNGEERIGLKTVQLNKCPVLAPAKTLLPENAERLGIDREACLKNLATLKANSELLIALNEVFTFEKEFSAESNPEYRLYEGFTSTADQHQKKTIHQHPIPEQWKLNVNFEDPKLNQLWRLYKARYFTSTLSQDDATWWQQYRTDKLMHGVDKPNLTMEEFQMALESCAMKQDGNEKNMAILKELYLYVQSI
ncbi:exodeoxyribonuclease I [Psychrosphaera sp.]|nr:exodeoxyribonuclease I [Psychrosphaera sp.]